MRPGVVAFDHEVFELVVEDGGGLATDHKLRVRARRAGKLQLDLLEVVLVDVTVAARPDEVTHLEIALLRHHVREQRIAGDVKWHAQEDVATALIELAGELAVCHVELKEAVARRQSHLVDFGRVPCDNQVTAAVGVLLDAFDEVADLIDLAAVGSRPAAPLNAVDRAQVAVFVGPFVPNRHAVVVQILDVA